MKTLPKYTMRKRTWEQEWQEFKGLNPFGKMLAKAERKTMKKILAKINLKAGSKIIDIGCGTGKNLIFFKKLGFKNTVGIDVSKTGLSICNKKGLRLNKDIFNMDATSTKFKSNKFDLVFSDGLLEHFKDFTPFVKEMCRISKRYVLLFQPNHFSLYGKLISLLNRRPVKEYTYSINDYKKSFERFGFDMIYSKGYNFNEHFALLFKRRK